MIKQDRAGKWDSSYVCASWGSRSVCVCLWGWEGDGVVVVVVGGGLYLCPPSNPSFTGPWGAGRAAAETQKGSSFVNVHQSLSSVSPVTPNP